MSVKNLRLLPSKLDWDIKIKIFPFLCLEIHLHGYDICVIDVTTLELFHALKDCTIQFIKRFCKDCFQN